MMSDIAESIQRFARAATNAALSGAAYERNVQAWELLQTYMATGAPEDVARDAIHRNIPLEVIQNIYARRIRSTDLGKLLEPTAQDMIDSILQKRVIKVGG